MLNRETNRALWFAFLGPPAIWFAQFIILYVMAEINCNTRVLGFAFLGLSGMQLISLLVSLVAGFIAIRALGAANHQARVEPSAVASLEQRRAFMSLAGRYFGYLFLLVILATLLPVFIVPPCG